jgi:hypothetical protein
MIHHQGFIPPARFGLSILTLLYPSICFQAGQNLLAMSSNLADGLYGVDVKVNIYPGDSKTR